MQAYEVLSCAVLAVACITYNLSMRDQWRITRAGVMLLCASAIVRGACLIAKYTSVANMAGVISIAADANIPLMTAVVLGSIVWQRIQNRRGQSEST
jgi:hypothetical protein